MTIRTSKQAMAVAQGQTQNVPGTCQKNVREWFNAPSAGDQDKDGDFDAVDGWLSEPRSKRHPGDRNPPPGKPLSFDGGSKGYGHRALSTVGGVRSTDFLNNRYTPGKTSTVTARTMSEAIAIIEQRMGVRYLGWSDTIDGYPIPPDAAPKPPPAPPVKAVMTIRVASNNLMSLPKNKNVQNAIRANNTIPIVGFQEADPVSFKTALKKRYPKIMGLGPANEKGQYTDYTYAAPLVVNATLFTHVNHGTEVIHNASAGISHKRRLTWAIVERKDSKIRLGVINLHAVLGKKDKLYEQRMKMRASDKAALKKQVDKFQAMGLPIIITGDFNDTANWLGATYGGQRVQRATHRVDQILVVNSEKYRWTINSYNHADTTSDHDVLRAQVSLFKR